MLEYLQAALLAIIQGAAELLPVSSSAHVILAQKLMGLDPAAPKMVFLLVMLHTGTMGAVLVYFWPRWKRLVTAGDPEAAMPASRFLVAVGVATTATALLGGSLLLLIEKITGRELEQLFKHLPYIGTALFLVGGLIVAAGFAEGKTGRSALTLRDAVLIGLVQGLSLPFRGFSRSGATISTGLFLGVSRRLAEDFSFALAVVITPPVIGYSLLKLLKKGTTGPELLREVGPGLAGMLFSFAAGLLALRLLSATLEKGRWRFFGYYCLVAAFVVAAAAYAGY